MTGLLLLALLAQAPAAPTGVTIPPPTAVAHDAWVYTGEPFKFQFDHDGDAIDGFYVEVNNQTTADVPVSALLGRVGTVTFATGLPVGTYVFTVQTYTGGVVTATTDPFRLEVRPTRGDGAAEHLRIAR